MIHFLAHNILCYYSIDSFNFYIKTSISYSNEWSDKDILIVPIRNYLLTFINSNTVLLIPVLHTEPVDTITLFYYK